MGVALTHVLLSLNQKNTQLNLRDFPEMLPNLCLVGMNFHLSGVDEKARNWSGLNLSGIDFRGAHLKEVQFEKSELDGANLQNADLFKVNLQDAELNRAALQGAELDRAELQGAELDRAELQNADLFKANLQGAKLDGAKLQGAKLNGAKLQNASLRRCALSWAQLEKVNDVSLTGSKITIYDFTDKFYPEWKAETDSEWETLTGIERMAAMKKFFCETGVYIFNEWEEQIMP